MMKIGFAVAAAAAVLMTVPSLVSTTPAKAQTLKMAQGVDVQLGRDRDDRDRRRRNDSDVTIGVGPGGVTVGPRQNCRMVTTTVERDDGRTITRKERRCDKARATRNNNCSSVATVNYPEPPPPWRSRGSGYAGKLTKGRGTRSRRW